MAMNEYVVEKLEKVLKELDKLVGQIRSIASKVEELCPFSKGWEERIH